MNSLNKVIRLSVVLTTSLLFVLLSCVDVNGMYFMREPWHDQLSSIRQDLLEIRRRAGDFSHARVWRSSGMLWIENEKMLGMGLDERLHFEKRFDMTLDQLPEERTNLANHLHRYIDQIKLFIQTFPEQRDKIEEYRAEAQHLLDSLDHLEVLARQAIERRTHDSAFLIGDSE